MKKPGIKILSIILMTALFLAACARPQTVTTETAPDANETAAVDDNETTESEEKEKEPYDGLPPKEKVSLDPKWDYAENSVINSGNAVLYRARSDRKNVVIAVNAGHGTHGGDVAWTYCHPDKSPKITNGSNPAGALKAVAISLGMTFNDGSTEAEVTLKLARIVRDRLLERGYDVLMIRDDDDVQLDNVARTVISNNMADCLISLHWDSDGLKYDKGCFVVPIPEEIKEMEPVASHWKDHEKLGRSMIDALSRSGCTVYHGISVPQELTQTCYSTIPSVLIELGNETSSHTDEDLSKLANGLIRGIDSFISN